MKKFIVFCFSLVFLFTACAGGPQTKTGKGAAYGAVGGAVAGALVGQAVGRDQESTLLGAAIGATLLGGTGAGIGKMMDQQEAEVKEALTASEAASVQREDELIAITLKGDVAFDTGSAVVRPGLSSEIGFIAGIIDKYSQFPITVEGHTDNKGSEYYNMKLSRKRAEAVKDILVKHGVEPSRINVMAYGEAHPIADNSTIEGRQWNNRLEIKISPPSSESIIKHTLSEINLGTYHALLIAVQNYELLPPLDYPVQDALKIKDILTQHYTFDEKNIIFLKDPDRKTILNTLDNLQHKLTLDDNLLIFYAGHGSWDKNMEQGFWLPRNASSESDRSEWLFNSVIQSYIRAIKTRHTLLISDACFSGSIFKTREGDFPTAKAVQEIYKLRSRRAITSGAMETVPDKSVFLKYLIRRLQENENKYFRSRELYDDIVYPIIHNSPKLQKPLDGVILGTDDENGDFIFVRRR